MEAHPWPFSALFSAVIVAPIGLWFLATGLGVFATLVSTLLGWAAGTAAGAAYLIRRTARRSAEST